MQRLANKEIDDRVVVKIDRSIKRTNEGVNGLMMYGGKNDYPQVMEKLINSSVTAKAAANIKAKFLAGLGFENETINDIVVGQDSRGKDITIRSLLSQVATSAAIFQGYYIHANKTLKNKVKDVYLHDFKNCRFSKPDDTGFSAKLLYYENWEKDRNKGNFNKKDIISYHLFSKDPAILAAQIKDAGGVDENGVVTKNFKGQVYFHYLDNTYYYPLSSFDSAYLDIDTEAQVSLFKNRQLRNGFFDKVLISTAFDGTESDKDDATNRVKEWMGADGDTVLVVDADVDGDGNITEQQTFRFDKVESNVDDKLFQNWEKGLANNIRKSVGGIPAMLIDYEDGAMSGTSGESIIQATNYYNALTADDRAQISKSFAEIFKDAENEILASNENWTIKELSIIANGTTDTDTTTSN